MNRRQDLGEDHQVPRPENRSSKVHGEENHSNPNHHRSPWSNSKGLRETSEDSEAGKNNTKPTTKDSPTWNSTYPQKIPQLKFPGFQGEPRAAAKTTSQKIRENLEKIIKWI